MFFAFILWYFQVPKVNERNIWNKMRFCMRVLPCIPSPRVTDIASWSSDSVSICIPACICISEDA